jgi:Fur family ferric uptake transcriptional regulator/Fur family peroxide stress response transcriptional regulator
MSQRIGGLRATPQRQAVLDVLRAAPDHPTAGEVFDRVRRVAPRIGAATVYRTLALLVRTGAAREVTLGDGATVRYDGNTARHDHLVCEQCGRAADVDRPLPEPMIAGVVAESGYRITGYDVRFRGICPECAAESHC